MAKAKRPNMLSEDVFRASLHEQNCHPKYVDAYLGDCKLLVPLLIREIGEEQFLEIANKCRAELGLKPVDTYWLSRSNTSSPGRRMKLMITRQVRQKARV